jgi:hypothetical protein
VRLAFLSACMLLTVAVSAGSSSESSVLDDPKKASESQQTGLDGRWALFSITFGGSGCAFWNPTDDGVGIDVQGHRVSRFWNGTVGLKLATDGCKEIDLVHKPEEGLREVLFGIYEVRDNILSITVGWSSQARPKAVYPEKDKNDWIRYSFKRVKSKPAK